MVNRIKQKIVTLLRKSEKYTGTDMVYLVKGSFWWILGRAVLLLLGLITMIAFSHWLPKETFGAYQYILSIVAILAIFSLGGINTALVRTVAKGNEGVFWPCAKTRFRWALITLIGCLLIAGWYLIQQNFILGISFLMAGLFFPFIATFNLFTSFWQGKKKFDLQAKYQVLLNLFSVSILLLVLFFSDNLVMIVLAFLISSTLGGAIFFKLTLNQIRFHEKELIQSNSQENEKQNQETISYGKHLTLMSSLGHFSAHLDKVIIWQMLGPVPLAIYSFAQLPLNKVHEIIPIGPLAFPKLSERNVKEIKKEIFQKFLKLFLFSIPLVGLVIFLAPYFYKMVFPSYLDSIPYFQALAFSLIFIPFQLLGISLLTEMKKRELYLISFSAPLFQLVLFLILVPLFQIWGIIFAILIAQLFGNLLTLYFFKKI